MYSFMKSFQIVKISELYFFGGGWVLIFEIIEIVFVGERDCYFFVVERDCYFFVVECDGDFYLGGGGGFFCL